MKSLKLFMLLLCGCCVYTFVTQLITSSSYMAIIIIVLLKVYSFLFTIIILIFFSFSPFLSNIFFYSYIYILMIHFVCKFSISRLCWFSYGLKKKTENLSCFLGVYVFFSRLRLNLFLFALHFPLSLSRSLSIQFISNKGMEINNFFQLITGR